MKRNLSFLFLSLILSSCAGTLPYSLNYPLTTETFHSRDGLFTGNVPQGWFFSSEDTLAPALLAWLVKEDLSAALAFEELHLDKLSAQRVDKEGLTLLAYMSLMFQQASSSTEVVVPPKEFKMRGKEFCGYEITSGGEHKRVVVFTARGKYYECRATPLKGSWTTDDLIQLFTAQQVLLSTISF